MSEMQPGVFLGDVLDKWAQAATELDKSGTTQQRMGLSRDTALQWLVEARGVELITLDAQLGPAEESELLGVLEARFAELDPQQRRTDLQQLLKEGVQLFLDGMHSELGDDVDARGAIERRTRKQQSKFINNRVRSRAGLRNPDLAAVAKELTAALVLTVLTVERLDPLRAQLVDDAVSLLCTDEVSAAWDEMEGSIAASAPERAKNTTRRTLVVRSQVTEELDQLANKFNSVRASNNQVMGEGLQEELTGPTPVQAFEGEVASRVRRAAFPSALERRDSRIALELGTQLMLARVSSTDLRKQVEMATVGLDLRERRDTILAARKLAALLGSEQVNAERWDSLMGSALLCSHASDARGTEVSWLPEVVNEIAMSKVGLRLRDVLPLGGTGFPWWSEPFTPATVALHKAFDDPKAEWSSWFSQKNADERSNILMTAVNGAERRLLSGLVDRERNENRLEFRGPTELNKFIKGCIVFELPAALSQHISAPLGEDRDADARPAAADLLSSNDGPVLVPSLLQAVQTELTAAERSFNEIRVTGLRDLREWILWKKRGHGHGRTRGTDGGPTPVNSTGTHASAAAAITTTAESFAEFTHTSVWLINHPTPPPGARIASWDHVRELLAEFI